MEFRDIKDVLTFAAFRPEPDNSKAPWPKRFPGKRTVLLNVGRASTSWRTIDKSGRVDDFGSADGEFLDVASQMADEWRATADDGWIGVSMNSRFIVSLEHNLSRKKGFEDTIRSNPKSILGTKHDRTKRYALHHNPETSASLLLACDDSLVKTIEEAFRNHNLRPARICCGLFAMQVHLLNRIAHDDKLKNQDIITVVWNDGSLAVLRMKGGQWQELRCRSGLQPTDTHAVSQMLKPFLDAKDANTRIIFMGDDTENQFSKEYLPQLENHHVTDVTEPNQLWAILSRN
ncbi:MAG: hypothetical protein KDM91_09140 [Verrucomicrobiae bacterium]|nr:hypothetical protein [Verrucomicrobiae bacterium]MCP5539506.1 hypothetical protein [Akkermansiaceae bacterium]MCP5550097.1 hypothetical protein [Akkermansiaceae bacterium]